MQVQSGTKGNSNEWKHSQEFDARILEKIFDDCFSTLHATCLRPSPSDDPEYVPGVRGELSCIFYAHGFFSSALHEIAHWCIAGPKRRCLRDFGYPYRFEERSVEEQGRFLQFEARNQGLEWVFSAAVGMRFYASLDLPPGLRITKNAENEFLKQIRSFAVFYYQVSLPKDAAIFLKSLREHYSADETAYWAGNPLPDSGIGMDRIEWKDTETRSVQRRGTGNV